MRTENDELVHMKVSAKCKLPNELTRNDFRTIVADQDIHETNEYHRAAVIRHHGEEAYIGHFTVAANRGGGNVSVFDDNKKVVPQTEHEGEDFSEMNWRCAAYRYAPTPSQSNASSQSTALTFQFDAEFLNEDAQPLSSL